MFTPQVKTLSLSFMMIWLERELKLALLFLMLDWEKNKKRRNWSASFQNKLDFSLPTYKKLHPPAKKKKKQKSHEGVPGI
jgi:hypothetical protein